MFEDDIGIGVYRPDMIGVVFEDIDPGLIILAPGGGIAQRVLLSETLREVKAESIYPIGLHPPGECAFDIIFGLRAFMIEVAAHIKIMFGDGVEPGVISRRSVVGCIPVELCQWGLTKCVIVDYIQDDGHTAGVAGFDEIMESVGRPIIFIQGQVVGWIVSPAGVAFKFIDRHKFYRIDA